MRGLLAGTVVASSGQAVTILILLPGQYGNLLLPLTAHVRQTCLVSPKMSDPFSIAAGVVGIASLAGQVFSGINSFRKKGYWGSVDSSRAQHADKEPVRNSSQSLTACKVIGS